MSQREKAGDGPIRVMIVDDHPMVRQGLRLTIQGEPDLVVCAEASDTSSGLRAYLESHPMAAIIDLSLEGRSGIDLIEQIHSMDRHFPMLVLSVHDEVTYVERALKAGARGYAVKSDAPRLVVDALRRVVAGEVCVSNAMSGKLLGRMFPMAVPRAAGNPITALTNRELDVLEAIGRGLHTVDVAAQLKISVHTVETYRVRIKDKLGLRSAADLYRFAVQRMNNEGAADSGRC